ncbi:hypothetical protein ACWC10_00345 [Streptomyces sp. NPDC001595]|uniref:hypothetical protein n=1 Tax=Streptomyces sp. NPDC001532 TaxID=3154520 RepID=UPI00331D3DF9
MFDFTKGAKSQSVTCPQCGADVEQKPGAGRVRQYCTPGHGKAWRRRMRHAGWL